jgi:hypothetical protein
MQRAAPKTRRHDALVVAAAICVIARVQRLVQIADQMQ